MITIAEAADRIGEFIGEQAELQSEVKKICYGIECLLIMLISITIILGLGWLCGVFKETAMITLAALLMKYIIGGPHLSGFSRCTSFSVLILISAAWLLKAYGNPLPLWLIALAAFWGSAALLYGSMLASEFNFSKKQIRTRKILGVFVLVLLAGLNIWRYDLSAPMVGAWLTVMLRTPIGILIVHWVEQITKGKEVQST
jgi:accessory gene regulator protein AgrB